jgi:UDP-2,3-diacylglucosamine pyrophosphatase LpxH
MDFVEASPDLEAKSYARPLRYRFDPSLADANRPFRYVFDEGGLSCSKAVPGRDRICYAGREALTTVAKHRPSFVYLDVGCWADDADGEGMRRRDFGLVCGQHVYLCQYVDSPVVPNTRVPSVRGFFEGLARLGCGAEVVAYARAQDFDRKTCQDPNLYLLLGDLHLPPVTWFYSRMAMASPPVQDLPAWLEGAPAMVAQTDRVMRSAYECAAYHRAVGDVPEASLPGFPNPDISRHAGESLVCFLDALAKLDQEVRRRLHFVHLGDMFELWVGRRYHLVPGPDGEPTWRYPQSRDVVADWCLEVMIQNAPVFWALKRLEGAGLAEVKYVAGNHDGYLLKPELTTHLGLRPRDPLYRGLNGDLLAEHGHRFDSANFDNVDGTDVTSGPRVSKHLLRIPFVRKLEETYGTVRGLWKAEQRDVHLLGATLLFLEERFELEHKPFSIYAMGHSHRPVLGRFDIRAEYAVLDKE